MSEENKKTLVQKSLKIHSCHHHFSLRSRYLKATRTQRRPSWPCSTPPLWPGTSGSTLRPGTRTGRRGTSAWELRCWAARCQVHRLQTAGNTGWQQLQTAGNSFYMQFFPSAHFSFLTTDPNNIYPWQTEPAESRDKLDFRHHNYKEMRKVGRDDVIMMITLWQPMRQVHI